MNSNDISLGALRIANPDEDESHTPSPPPGVPPPNIATISTERPPPSSHSSDSASTARPRASSALPDSTLQQPRDPEVVDSPSITGTTLRKSPTQKAHNIINNAARYSQGPGSLSMPLAHQSQQQATYPTSVHPRSYPPPGSKAVRPVSGMYNHPNASTGSSSVSNTSYRYNDNPAPAPQPYATGIGRTGSTRKSAAAMQQAQAGVASQDSSYTDRSYLSSQPMYGGNGPAPPRRSSRRVSPSNPGPSSSMAAAAAAAALGGTSAPSASVLSGSPYGRENGPLASTDEWQERGAAVGVQREVDANGNVIQRPLKKGVRDFDFGRTLGEGSYSTVLAAKDRQTGREYAIKVLDKKHIIKEKKVKYVNIEKDTLNRLTDHPGVVRLYYTFQDERSLYFVLDLASGGELLGVLKKYGTFDVDCTQFYGAQILDTIEYMHKKGCIHRDLKPENVLLDSSMHVKITDFGTAKLLDNPSSNGSILDGSNIDRANSFVGTAEYVSPELLTDKNACKASDLWAFGCIIYQLLAGRPPFKAANEYLTFQKIVALEYTFPDGFPEVAKDLVERLLVLDPMKRLPIEHIKNHEFFDGVMWGKGLWKQKAPKLKPYVPPAQQPIRLNGPTSSAATSSAQLRPQPRVITELPPPSQLDIEWSPVLVRNNERILKLGNLIVTSAPPPSSPTARNGEPPKPEASGFRKFFGSSNLKKRQRLVMVTSSAHLVMAAAGGDEKKAKIDINLLTGGCTWRSYLDGKGLTVWCLDTKDKQFIFEDPKVSTADPDGSKYSTAEWLESIDSAKDFALSQSLTNSYSTDSGLNDLSSAISSPSSTLNVQDQLDGVHVPMTQRHLRRKGRPEPQNEEDAESVRSLKGRKRFSRRHSRNGLAAVF